MKPVGDALREILHGASALPVERLPLLAARGRILASPLAVREDVPGFDNSAMDGYAVRAAELSDAAEDTPARMPVVGESRAGGELPSPLTPGSVMRIFTGAPMPDGADAVVIQEDTDRDGDQLALRVAPPVGDNVRPRGEVLRVGQTLLPAGTRIGPGEVAVLAGQSFGTVPVHRRPRVAVLSTGDELREIGAPARQGSLVDSNRYALAAAVEAAGAEPLVLDRGPDDTAVLSERLREGLRAADVVVSTGGASVGDHDHLHEAYAEVGIESRFWKVRMKPGKPVRFARHEGRYLLGLPGNPVSALVTFELLVRPLLRTLMGDPRPFRPRVTLPLAADARPPTTRSEFARAMRDDHGRARLFAKQGSSIITSMVGNELLVVLPIGAGALPAGHPVEALDTTDGASSATWPIPDGV